MDDLDALLREAAAADAGMRIEFRDRIAAFGSEAIVQLEPWLCDPRLGAFAVRTIERAAAMPGAAQAARVALKRAATSGRVHEDVHTALARLGGRTRPHASAMSRGATDEGDRPAGTQPGPKPVLSQQAAAMAIPASLIDAAWSLYSSAGGTVVRPSVPILWFGDSVAFAHSDVRVVTVGLNPSRLEFPQSDRFLRFSAARGLTAPPATALGRIAYVSALDSYFRSEPYRPWFDRGFERVLNGLSASYYDGLPNTALHTDLLSPLATDPTWGQLANEDRTLLIRGGTPLWHKLIRALQPDVIVVSVARAHLDRIRFPRLGGWRVIHAVDRDNPFVTEAVDIEVVPGKRTLLVLGRCLNVPFGSVSHEAKFAIGAAIGADRA